MALLLLRVIQNPVDLELPRSPHGILLDKSFKKVSGYSFFVEDLEFCIGILMFFNTYFMYSWNYWSAGSTLPN